MANKWTCLTFKWYLQIWAQKRTGPRTRQPRHDISKTDSKQPMWLWKQHLHVCFMIHRKGIKKYPSCRISNYVKCTRGCPQNIYEPSAFVLRTSPLVLSSNSSFSKHRWAFPSSLFPGAGAVKESDPLSLWIQDCLYCLGTQKRMSYSWFPVTERPEDKAPWSHHISQQSKLSMKSQVPQTNLKLRVSLECAPFFLRVFIFALEIS